jgi:hypothetical protein
MRVSSNRPRPGAVPLDRVVEPEARAAHVAAARADREPVVEPSRIRVARVGLERESIDAFLPEPRIAAAKPAQVLDPRHLEPDEIRRVMGDSLGIGLGEADGHVVRERELHRA